jgi:Flp pilus assembly protein TadG
MKGSLNKTHSIGNIVGTVNLMTTTQNNKDKTNDKVASIAPVYIADIPPENFPSLKILTRQKLL